MDQVEAIRRSCGIARKTMSYARGLDAVGMTEKELADKIDEKMRALGADRNAFETIVGAGENGAEIHHEPEGRVIQEGEPVVIDVGCVYKDYCSDMTRTVVFQGEPSERFRKIFDIVSEAQTRAIRAVEAGVNAREVDAVARGHIEKKGFGDNFVHSTGHGLGKEVHEEPSISSSSEAVLEKGDVVTVEPGIYIEGEFGVRIEDAVLVTEDGSELLSD